MLESNVGLFKGENKHCMEVFSGAKVDPFNCTEEDIKIEDIAHALSNICRYGGHCSQFYSVAEHSCRVASIVPYDIGLAGLLHDAAEAYLGDIVRPLKHQFPDIVKAQGRLLYLIYSKYSIKIDAQTAKLIVDADNVIGSTEARDLMASGGKEWGNLLPPLPDKIEPWASWIAEDTFLKHFRFYGGE